MNIGDRPIYTKGSQPKAKTRKGVRQISAKKAAHDASPAGRAGKAHMRKVRRLPCCICNFYGMTQLSITRVHHCMDGGERDDMQTISLCGGHHNREDADNSKIAYHHRKDTWRNLYGKDIDWLSWVEKMLKLQK